MPSGSAVDKRISTALPFVLIQIAIRYVLMKRSYSHKHASGQPSQGMNTQFLNAPFGDWGLFTLMKHFRFALIGLLLSVAFLSCKKDDNTPAPTAQSQTDLLVANKWLLNRVSTTDDKTIGTSQMNTTTLLLFELDMQFKNDGTVRAINHLTGQIPNGGTWKLASDNQSIDVDVTGFKGNFPIVELTKTKLTLRQRAPVNGVDTDINLEFAPSL